MNRRKKRTAGSAVVELAICLPFIVTVIFASIEACNMVALKQVLAESAYDGALMALRPKAKKAEVIAGINAALAARNVTPLSVSLEGPGGLGYGAAVRGDLVTVTIEAVTNANMTGPQFFGLALTLTSKATAVKQ